MANQNRERLPIDQIAQPIEDQQIRDIKTQTLRLVVIPLICLFGGVVLFAVADLFIEKIVTKTDPSTSLDFFKSILSFISPLIALALGYIFGKNI